MTKKIKASNIDTGAVTADKLHTTAITDKLGFTPVTPTQLSTAVAAVDLTGLATETFVTTAASTKADTVTTVTKDSSTGAALIPVGTTAQRPVSPTIGMVRYNTTSGALENYTINGWLKVSVSVPILTTITGGIYTGLSTTLTLNGQKFGTSAGVVRFTSGATVKDVTVTPSSQTLATVLVPSEIYNLSATSSVEVKFTNDENGVSGGVFLSVIGLPSGGTSTTSSGGYRYHTFLSSNNLVVPTGFTANANYLIVAGGGGGGCGSGTGYESGGAGAGGLLSGNTTLSAQTYSVVVGGGGSPHTQGASSSAFSFNAVGGGRGADGGEAGGSGGSGGGGAHNQTAGGSGTSGQGNNGATPSAPSLGGGGGGATAVGGTSDGGAGLNWLSLGTYYAGGGAGVRPNAGSSGGIGGGGSSPASFSAGGNASTNTGGGGGGAYAQSVSLIGGSGGSGIVIIRYPIPS